MRQCQAASEKGLHESAIRYCTAAIAAEPSGRALAHFYRANSYLSTGRAAPALADIEASLDLDGENGRSFALRGAIRLKQGDAAGAVADFDRALELGFTDIQVHHQRASAWLAIGKPENAVGDLEAILAADPRDAITLTRLALALREIGDIAGARDAIERAIRANPDYTPALAVRATIAGAGGDADAAVADFSRAAAAAPGQPAYHLGLGEAHLQAGRLEDAIREVDQAIAIDPDLAAARIFRAEIREKNGDLAGALSDLDVAAAGGNAPLLWRARIALKLGRYERAESDYTTVIDAGSEDPLAFFERGQTRVRLGRDGEAAADFSRALLLDTALTEKGLMLMRGQARYRAGVFEAALADFTAESGRLPDAPRPLIWRILTLSELGALDDAERDAHRLVALEPQAARAHAILGDVLLKKGNIAAGRAEHEAALKLDPAFEVSRQRLDQLGPS